ncbi:MAG: nucleotidyltransferase family protein [Candidatus Eisenbacteria bacterium]|uniref:Nucleotidyltransferase family protein n=1 Tax=Eiseniibacteriota bacterium TaxID=2212470 RepID=A0A948RVN4_UNCEI|nr:nucleotidyltransferase family protein [Candidatus Eisenbacteria bacterium]MBU1949345.1 nucleotidyltransferase family protein [Candidatus Eisenbacteria bacterium]MBU2690418.1 nucleotidyltransferase family protein [Candidatus Eisenbacteria bacterium]
MTLGDTTYSRPKIAVLILCAGASRRMRFPKFLLEIQRKSAVSLISSIALEQLEGPVAIVARPEEREIIETLSGLPDSQRLYIIENSDPDAGRTGSIQAGLQHFSRLSSESPSGCLIWPVDLPLVRPQTVRRLGYKLEWSGPSAVIIPTWESRGGHPVAVGKNHWPALFEMGPDTPLRELWKDPKCCIEMLPVEDPGIRVDLNTPEEAERWLGAPARPWSP